MPIYGPNSELLVPSDPDCEHLTSMPEFDEQAARGLSSHEVRTRWPRFMGHCHDCGVQMILYASWAHYIHGDW